KDGFLTTPTQIKRYNAITFNQKEFYWIRSCHLKGLSKLLQFNRKQRSFLLAFYVQNSYYWKKEMSEKK
uniref:Uncharacterized protein n=1 Tax=Echinococcus canadensis TaxID=519352 RepID=A0A915EZZ8_9CEST